MASDFQRGVGASPGKPPDATLIFSGMTRRLRATTDISFMQLAHEYVNGCGNCYWVRLQDQAVEPNGAYVGPISMNFSEWVRLLFMQGDRLEVHQKKHGMKVTVMVRSWPQQPRLITAYDLLYDHMSAPRRGGL